ncbi:prolyl oligopeptidase family serine peptidase [Chryseobacterium sp. LC2016-27]|uniref:alpha/beta hydrolase family protein n=1 Tax=Chryseobacterium sp. LC2016-27 TaxID=2897326 RepID=UPI001E612D14|nr:prolyl oligopeptidase family serine peptidase [Chryseobacterium sp. LC2016-27]MCD0456328.1 prolyl oligopeptidase family serine peptidase [Chryseobacterium sp. LC2016-27]
MSDNGNWLAWQSAYERRPAEMRVASVNKSRPIFTEAGARQWQFVRDNEIIYLLGQDAKYRDLAKQKELTFFGVKSAGYCKDLDLIYFHYNDTSSDRLDLYDKNMNIARSFSNVRRVVEMNGNIIIIRKDEAENELIKYDGKKGLTIFTSSSEIYSVSSAGLKSGGWTVRVKSENGLRMFFIGADLSSTELSIGGKTQFDAIQQNPSSDADAVFLTVETKLARKNEMVDIWYAQDFDLEDHFRDQKLTSRVLWYPLEKRIVETDDRDYSSIAAIGRSGLFLRSAVDHEQVDKNDKTAVETVKRYFMYDPKTEDNTFLADTSRSFVIDSLGQFILYIDRDKWFCYSTSERKKLPELAVQKNAIPHFISSEEVLWIIGNEFWIQNLRTLKKRLVASLVCDTLEILNVKRDKSLVESNLISQTVHINDEIILKLIGEKQNTSSIVVWNSGKVKVIVDQVKDRISEFIFNASSARYSWISENYNKAPEIKMVVTPGHVKSFYTAAAAAKNSSGKITMKQLKYKGMEGEDLNAILYFPPDYSDQKTYPVAVSIYEIQKNSSNRYLKPTYRNSRGFNERLFLEMGYMVMLPDINNVGSQGPGIAALHNVNAALDELTKVKQADMKKVGLIGQSYGGYETNFIATQSDRFAAYISGASIADIVNTSFAFNYNFFSADYYRYEDGQFKLGKFTDDKEKYYQNNPLYYAEQVKSPVLLWTGTNDKNVSPEQTLSFYNALRKYRKDVVALFYKNEQHSLMGYEQRKDLTIRMLEWFDYFLCGKRDVSWIGNQ